MNPIIERFFDRPPSAGIDLSQKVSKKYCWCSIHVVSSGSTTPTSNIVAAPNSAAILDWSNNPHSGLKGEVQEI